MIQNEKLDMYHSGPDGWENDWPSVPLFLGDGTENHDNFSAHCAITAQIINIVDVYCESGYDFRSTREFDRATGTGCRSRSML
ncbi:MAG: hypothetical protein ABIJ50_05465 [Pseudomonadota bacterium]